MIIKVDKYGIVHLIPDPLTVREKIQYLLTIAVVLGVPTIIILFLE